MLAAEQRGVLEPLRTGLTILVYPLQQAISIPVRLVQEGYESLSSYSRLVLENRQLREEQLMLKTRLLKFAALEQENLRLRGLLETSFKVGEQVLIAELLSVKLVPYEHIVIVNKGSRFGVYAGQPVVDASGVVGQVLRTTPFGAEVMLITDPNHAIPVQVNRNGLRTIAVGTGHIDQLLLPYLPQNADIHEGDLLVTSGLGGVFPHGYPVATVNSTKSPSGPFSKLSATPAARLDRVHEVLMVWNKPEPIPRVHRRENVPDHAAEPHTPKEPDAPK
jgi:rod shape-determining protein MreC